MSRQAHPALTPQPKDLFDHPIRVGDIIAYPVGQGGISFGLVLDVRTTQRQYRPYQLGILKYWKTYRDEERFNRTRMEKTDDAVVVHPSHYNEDCRKLVAHFQTLQGKAPVSGSPTPVTAEYDPEDDE